MQRAAQRHQAGDLAGAEPLYRQLLAAQPGHADGWHLLGVLLSATGRHAEALEAIRRALALRGNDAAFHNNLGEVQRALGQLDDAAAAYRRALALRPEMAEAHFNLGNILKTQEQHQEAIACYRRAIQLRPGYAKAHYNLANAQREQGRVKDAVAAYRQALAIAPNWADAHLNLGVALAELDETVSAIACLQRAGELDPAADVDGGLGNAYADLGRLAEAADAYRRELTRYPERWVRQLRIASIVEPVAPSNAAIDAYRAGLMAALDRIAVEPHPAIDLEKLHSSGAEPPMALAYQGCDDRPLRERWARLFTGRLPTVSPRRNDGPPHIGVVVTHGHEGVFYKCMGGLVDRLPAHGLRVTVVCCRSGRNILGQWLRHPELRYHVIPERVDQAAEAVAAAGYDVLYYWEIGTDSLNYFLPFARPAPVQCAGWGWPVTSGNPAIGYFVSSDLLEPEGGEHHFTERLVRLKRLPTWYRRPALPERLKPREHFGLDQARRFTSARRTCASAIPISTRWSPAFCVTTRAGGSCSWPTTARR
jgi:tetratricopeptide (TPR) repeat protein